MQRKKCPNCKRNRELRFYSSRLTRYCVDCKKKKARDKKKNSKRQQTKNQDRIWSKKIKELAGNKCEYCGKTDYLNSHHIFSRSKMSTRHYLPNGICLCSGHHTLSSTFSAHKTPAEFIEWIKEKRGEQWYEDLRQKANQIEKY